MPERAGTLIQAYWVQWIRTMCLPCQNTSESNASGSRTGVLPDRRASDVICFADSGCRAGVAVHVASVQRSYAHCRPYLLRLLRNEWEVYGIRSARLRPQVEAAILASVTVSDWLVIEPTVQDVVG